MPGWRSRVRASVCRLLSSRVSAARKRRLFASSALTSLRRKLPMDVSSSETEMLDTFPKGSRNVCGYALNASRSMLPYVRNETSYSRLAGYLGKPQRKSLRSTPTRETLGAGGPLFSRSTARRRVRGSGRGPCSTAGCLPAGCLPARCFLARCFSGPRAVARGPGPQEGFKHSSERPDAYEAVQAFQRLLHSWRPRGPRRLSLCSELLLL